MLEIKKGTNKFYIGGSEANPLAEITWVPSERNRVIANHTYVSNELRGQGVAKLLLERFIEWVREENLQVIPQCSFVKDQMEKNSDYHDLLSS